MLGTACWHVSAMALDVIKCACSPDYANDCASFSAALKPDALRGPCSTTQPGLTIAGMQTANALCELISWRWQDEGCNDARSARQEPAIASVVSMLHDTLQQDSVQTILHLQEQWRGPSSTLPSAPQQASEASDDEETADLEEGIDLIQVSDRTQ